MERQIYSCLKKLTNHVHKNGKTKIGAQILHGGRQVSHDDKVAPSPIPSLAVVKGIPRELAVKEISDVVINGNRESSRYPSNFRSV